MKPNNNFPVSVFQKAHAAYPQAVSNKGLYAVAFFGHARPTELTHKETCESVWRGLVRYYLRQAEPSLSEEDQFALEMARLSV